MRTNLFSSYISAVTANMSYTQLPQRHTIDGEANSVTIEFCYAKLNV